MNDEQQSDETPIQLPIAPGAIRTAALAELERAGTLVRALDVRGWAMPSAAASGVALADHDEHTAHHEPTPQDEVMDMGDKAPYEWHFFDNTAFSFKIKLGWFKIFGYRFPTKYMILQRMAAGLIAWLVIGLAVTLAHLGRIVPGSYRLDTPVGVVGFEYHGGPSATVANVPSYRHAAGVTVEANGTGPVTGDVAWGGNWFFLTDSPGLALDVTGRASFDRLLDQADERLGQLEVIINNDGIMPIGPFVQESDAMAMRIVDINLHGVLFGSKLAVERFITRGRGHIVQLASAAGKIGFPGGVTYCATKHAVVGLSEALRMELRGTGIDVSVVMPVVVDTELGSGLAKTRGFKPVPPDAVAKAIVEALQTGRFEVYVPRSMGWMVRFSALTPRRVFDCLSRLLRGDQVLAAPDHAARAAYEARMERTVA